MTSVDAVDVSAYTVPTDQPESDGALTWDSTTIVIVEVSAGGRSGLGHTYAHNAVAGLIAGKLRDRRHRVAALTPTTARTGDR